MRAKKTPKPKGVRALRTYTVRFEGEVPYEGIGVMVGSITAYTANEAKKRVIDVLGVLNIKVSVSTGVDRHKQSMYQLTPVGSHSFNFTVFVLSPPPAEVA